MMMRFHREMRVKWTLFWLLCLVLQGCMSFTERDYELQEKAYEKERQQKEIESQNSGVIRW